MSKRDVKSPSTELGEFAPYEQLSRSEAAEGVVCDFTG